MKKVFILSLLVYLISLSIHANEDKDFTGSLLWKVSGKDITKPSYILGTHHLAHIDLLKEINGFDDAFTACNVVIGELDFRNSFTFKSTLMSSINIEEGESYEYYLTKEQLDKLKADLFTELSLPFDMAKNFKPMMLTIMLTAKLHAAAAPDFDPMTNSSIDEHVQVEGMAKGKIIKGLESVEEQIEALLGDPFEDQLRELLCTLDDVYLGVEAIVGMNKSYKEGNLKALYDFSFGDEASESACPMTKEKKSKILDNRNDRWLEQLPQLLQADANFIAVGALHLAGEEGLLYQLHKMGYTVEAVK